MHTLARCHQGLYGWCLQNKPVQAQGQANRRVRMDRDQLEAELLSRFEKAPHWHFNQLQVWLGYASLLFASVQPVQAAENRC